MTQTTDTAVPAAITDKAEAARPLRYVGWALSGATAFCGVAAVYTGQLPEPAAEITPPAAAAAFNGCSQSIRAAHSVDAAVLRTVTRGYKL